MIINEDTEIQKLCKQITKLSTKEGVLDVKEQDRRLAMLYTDRCMPYVKFKCKPNKPDAIRRYDSLDKNKKFLFEKENPAWREWSVVSEYMSKCSGADAENDSNVYWLKHWMKLVDAERHKVLKLKLLEFEINMPTATRTPDTVTVYKKQPEEIQKVCDIFKGNEIKGGADAHLRKGMPR